MRVERVLTCECGFDARAADEEGLVAAVMRHAAEAHSPDFSEHVFAWRLDSLPLIRGNRDVSSAGTQTPGSCVPSRPRRLLAHPGDALEAFCALQLEVAETRASPFLLDTRLTHVRKLAPANGLRRYHIIGSRPRTNQPVFRVAFTASGGVPGVVGVALIRNGMVPACGPDTVITNLSVTLARGAIAPVE